MAGSSTYPTSVDNKTALQDGIDIIQADDVNNSYVPITSTQTFMGSNGKGASWSSDVLDYLCNTAVPIVTKASASTLSVSAGAVAIKNAGQTNRLMRRNTSSTTVTSSNLDTGSMADDTYYYVYAVADSAATTFTVKFSASASSPTGLTNFELIGWFYNESAGALDVTSEYVGNIMRNGRYVPNQVTITDATSQTIDQTSYTDVNVSTVKIYTSGRPVRFEYRLASTAASITNAVTGFYLGLSIDGSDEAGSEHLNGGPLSGYSHGSSATYVKTLAAGTHTIILRYKVHGSSSFTKGRHLLTVQEL